MPQEPINPNTEVDKALRELRALKEEQRIERQQNLARRQTGSTDTEEEQNKNELAGLRDEEKARSRYMKIGTPLAIGSGTSAMLYTSGGRKMMKEYLGVTPSEIAARHAAKVDMAKKMAAEQGVDFGTAMHAVGSGGSSLDAATKGYFDQFGYFDTPTGGVKGAIGEALYGRDYTGFLGDVSQGTGVGTAAAKSVGYAAAPALAPLSLGFGKAMQARRMRTYELQKDKLGTAGRVATRAGGLSQGISSSLFAPGAALFGMSQLPGIGGLAGAGATAWKGGVAGLSSGIGSGILSGAGGLANMVGAKGVGSGLAGLAGGSMAPMIAGGLALAMPSIISGIAGVKAEQKRRRLRGKREPHFRLEKQYSQSGTIDSLVQRLVSAQSITPAEQLIIEVLRQIESHTSVLGLLAQEAKFTSEQREKDVKETGKEYTGKLKEWDEEDKRGPIRKFLGNAMDKASLGLQKFSAHDPFQQLAAFVLEGKTPDKVFKELKQIQKDRDTAEDQKEHYKKVASQTGMLVSEVRLLLTPAATLSKMAESPEAKMIILQSGIYDILRGIASRDIEHKDKLKLKFDKKDDEDEDKTGFFDKIPFLAGVKPVAKLLGKGLAGTYTFGRDVVQGYHREAGEGRLKGLSRGFGSAVTNKYEEAKTGVKDLTDKVKGKYEDVIGSRFKKWTMGKDLYEHMKDPDKLKREMGLIKSGKEKQELFMEKALPGKLDEVTTYQLQQNQILQSIAQNTGQLVTLFGGQAAEVETKAKGKVYDELTGKYLSQDDYGKLVKQREKDYNDRVAEMTKPTTKGLFGNMKEGALEGLKGGAIGLGGAGLGVAGLAGLFGAGALPMLALLGGGIGLGAIGGGAKGGIESLVSAAPGDLLSFLGKREETGKPMKEARKREKEAAKELRDIEKFRKLPTVTEDELTAAHRASFGAGEESEERQEYERLKKIKEAQDMTLSQIEAKKDETMEIFLKHKEFQREQHEAIVTQLRQGETVRTLADENLTAWQKAKQIVSSIRSDIEEWRLIKDQYSRKDFLTGRLKKTYSQQDLEKLAREKSLKFGKDLKLDEEKDIFKEAKETRATQIEKPEKTASNIADSPLGKVVDAITDSKTGIVASIDVSKMKIADTTRLKINDVLMELQEGSITSRLTGIKQDTNAILEILTKSLGADDRPSDTGGPPSSEELDSTGTDDRQPHPRRGRRIIPFPKLETLGHGGKKVFTKEETITVHKGEELHKPKRLASNVAGPHSTVSQEIEELERDKMNEEKSKFMKGLFKKIDIIAESISHGFGTKKDGTPIDKKKGGLFGMLSGLFGGKFGALFGGIGATIAGILPLLGTIATGVAALATMSWIGGDDKKAAGAKIGLKASGLALRAGATAIESGAAGAKVVKGAKYVKDAATATKVGGTVSKAAATVGKGITAAKATKAGAAAAKVVGGASKVAGAGVKAAGAIAKTATVKTLGTLGKKIPVVGAIVGGGLALWRYAKGDKVGAAMELASGIASILPGPGTAVSIAIDAALLAKDIYEARKSGKLTPEMEAEEKKKLDELKSVMTPEAFKLLGGDLGKLEKLRENGKIIQDEKTGLWKVSEPKVKTAGLTTPPSQKKLFPKDSMTKTAMLAAAPMGMPVIAGMKAAKAVTSWMFGKDEDKVDKSTKEFLDKLKPKMSKQAFAMLSASKDPTNWFMKSRNKKLINDNGIWKLNTEVAKDVVKSATPKTSEELKDVIDETKKKTLDLDTTKVSAKPGEVKAPVAPDETRKKTKEKQNVTSLILQSVNEIISILKEGFILPGTKKKTELEVKDRDIVRKMVSKGVPLEDAEIEVHKSKSSTPIPETPPIAERRSEKFGGMTKREYLAEKKSKKGHQVIPISTPLKEVSSPTGKVIDTDITDIEKEFKIVEKQLETVKDPLLREFWRIDLEELREEFNAYKERSKKAIPTSPTEEVKPPVTEETPGMLGKISNIWKDKFFGSDAWKDVKSGFKKHTKVDASKQIEELKGKVSGYTDKAKEGWNKFLHDPIKTPEEIAAMGKRPKKVIEPPKVEITDGLDKEDTVGIGGKLKGVWSDFLNKPIKTPEEIAAMSKPVVKMTEKTGPPSVLADVKTTSPTSYSEEVKSSDTKESSGMFGKISNIWKTKFLGSEAWKDVESGFKKHTKVDTSEQVGKVGGFIKNIYDKAAKATRSFLHDPMESDTKSDVKSSNSVVSPTKSPIITSPFGPRKTKLSAASKQHKGTDFRAKFGDPIFSIMDGIVTSIGGRFGTITVDHGSGKVSKYTHLSKFDVKEGDKVSAGQKIGEAGATAPPSYKGMPPHLHLETVLSGKKIDPELLFHAAGIHNWGYAGDIVSDRQLAAKLQGGKIDIKSLKDEVIAGGMQENFNKAAKQSSSIFDEGSYYVSKGTGTGGSDGERFFPKPGWLNDLDLSPDIKHLVRQSTKGLVPKEFDQKKIVSKGEVKSGKITDKDIKENQQLLKPRRFEDTETGKTMLRQESQVRIPEYTQVPSVASTGVQPKGTTQIEQLRPVNNIGKLMVEQIFANTITNFESSAKQFALGQNPFQILR